MADPFARPVPVVDEQLATFATAQRQTQEQLANVRRQIFATIGEMRAKVTALEQHELTLLAGYGSREQRIDLLLDERLRSVAADRVVTA